MNNTNIKTIFKHPFIGTSLNLIETFLIVGYDTNEIQKTEIMSRQRDFIK